MLILLSHGRLYMQCLINECRYMGGYKVDGNSSFTATVCWSDMGAGGQG